MAAGRLLQSGPPGSWGAAPDGHHPPYAGPQSDAAAAIQDSISPGLQPQHAGRAGAFHRAVMLQWQHLLRRRGQRIPGVRERAARAGRIPHGRRSGSGRVQADAVALVGVLQGRQRLSGKRLDGGGQSVHRRDSLPVSARGADPRRIQLGIRGARKISRSEDGDLVLAMDEGEVRWHKPVVYQEKDGARREIAVHYAVKGKNRIGFEVADYDPRRPLFIDPLIYSTYLGGSGTDQGYGIAVDNSGSAYVAGYTTSTDFPTMNPLQPAKAGGDTDAFVAKLSPEGSALIYSTYLGGSRNDYGWGIAVDSLGNAYITGNTTSTDFPTMNPLQPAEADGGGDGDAFVAKLNPTGSALVYSTYLGGGGNYTGSGIAVDNSGNA